MACEFPAAAWQSFLRTAIHLLYVTFFKKVPTATLLQSTEIFGTVVTWVIMHFLSPNKQHQTNYLNDGTSANGFIQQVAPGAKDSNTLMPIPLAIKQTRTINRKLV